MYRMRARGVLSTGDLGHEGDTVEQVCAKAPTSKCRAKAPPSPPQPARPHPQYPPGGGDTSPLFQIIRGGYLEILAAGWFPADYFDFWRGGYLEILISGWTPGSRIENFPGALRAPDFPSKTTGFIRCFSKKIPARSARRNPSF